MHRKFLLIIIIIFACCVAVAGAHYTHRGNELTLVIYFYVNVQLVLIHLLTNSLIHTITIRKQSERFPIRITENFVRAVL